MRSPALLPCLWAALALGALASGAAGESRSPLFSVAADGRELFVHVAKVAPADQTRRYLAMDDKPNSASYYEEAAFTSFDLSAPVAVVVECPQPVLGVKILPSSRRIAASIAGRTIRFTVTQPGPLTLELNGSPVGALHLFVNPPERDAPRPDDPAVIYFGPGEHEVDNLEVRSGQTVYVAEDAIVRGRPRPAGRRGAVFRLTGDHITIRGRGIVDGSLCPTHTTNLIEVRNGTDILLEDVILRDSSVWTVPIRDSARVTVRNLKLIGYRANSDGIDICNSRQVEVAGCFIRTLDDLVVVKTLHPGAEAGDIRVHGCVLWNEVAHALSLGAELRADVSRVRFEDCDVIHDIGREWTLRVYHCDAARIRDIVFQNIRVEQSRRLISLWIGQARWSRDAERGRIEGVVFQDIDAPGGQPLPEIALRGFDSTHEVQDVRFTRVTRGGQPVRLAQVRTNEFVRALATDAP